MNKFENQKNYNTQNPSNEETNHSEDKIANDLPKEEKTEETKKVSLF